MGGTARSAAPLVRPSRFRNRRRETRPIRRRIIRLPELSRHRLPVFGQRAQTRTCIPFQSNDRPWQPGCTPGFAMLKITLDDSSAELCFRLEGRLSGPWVQELRQCWRTGASTTAGRRTAVDLREVDFIDAEGQTLLCEMYGANVELRANTPLIRSVVEEICRP